MKRPAKSPEVVRLDAALQASFLDFINPSEMRKTSHIPEKKFGNILTRSVTVAIVTPLAIALTSCSGGFSTASNSIVDKVDEELGCKGFEDRLWTAFTAYIESTGHPPSADELEKSLREKLPRSKRLSGLSEKNRGQLIDITKRLTNVVARQNDSLVSKKTAEENLAADSTISGADRELWLERVAQLEIGDRTTLEKSQDVDEARKLVAELNALAKDSGVIDVACVTPPDDPVPTPPPGEKGGLLEQWRMNKAAPVYGGLKTIGVAYQSCAAGDHQPLGKETDNIEGIEIVGQHSSGTGFKREIKDLKRFVASHPYLRTYSRPLPSCHDVLRAPPIYDYGGKPFTTTADEKLVDLFKNAGSGSKELGIDCSAFVYTAYGVSGLKLKKETSLKASLIKGVSSSMMADPQANGLSCLDHARFTKDSSLAAGDIIAIKGHVIMVEDVERDPFGVADIDNMSDCTLKNMDVANFRFTLFQSSPSKGGIGINRMRARDYLTNSSTMGAGLREHAVNACKARFGSSTVSSRSSKTSIVRHSGTPQCRETSLNLAKEECLSSCSARLIE